MTKDEAVEKCARAIARKKGYREDTWKDNSVATDFAEKLVESLEALGLIELIK